MSKRKLVSFDWALKRLLRSKANYEVLEGFLPELLKGDIEIQYEREFDYLQRILFATTKAITEHLSLGQSYENVVKVISINILYFDLGHGEDYVYHGIDPILGDPLP